MYIILTIIIIGLGFMANYFDENIKTSYEEDTWRQTLQEENEQIKKDMEQHMSNNEAVQNFTSSQIEKNNYHLENDIMPANYDAWQFVLQNNFLLALVTLFTIIVAAGIVANEFKWGTIKLLLIRPISRAKILLSKYISVLLFALWTLLYVLILSFIVGAVFFGINGFDPQIVTNQSGSYEQVSVITQIIAKYGLQLVTLLMMATFAFMISSVFRQSAIALGTALFLMFTGTAIVGFFADKVWAKYILFANTNLDQYVTGTPMMEDMTLGFSITVLIVYYVIFIAVTWMFFTKKDVAGS